MNILFGTDGSSYARVAEALIPRIAPTGAKVTVVMAAPAPNLMMAAVEPLAPFTSAEQAVEGWDESKNQAGAVAAAAASRLADTGLTVESLALEGEPGR